MALQYGTYSFKDIIASLIGPGGVVSMGAEGSATAEEGITIAPVEDKNTMVIGASGDGMHTLVAGNAAQITVRALRTSPMNSQLMSMYNLQRATSAAWGKNVFSLTNRASGDNATAIGVAFKRIPDLSVAKTAAIVEWTFDAISMDQVLGIY